MSNLVLINLVDLIVFFHWFFIVMTAPLIIVAATVYLIIELSWIGILGPSKYIATFIYIPIYIK